MRHGQVSTLDPAGCLRRVDVMPSTLNHLLREGEPSRFPRALDWKGDRLPINRSTIRKLDWLTTMLDRLFDPNVMRCTKCNATMAEGCNCWTKCRCGWSYETGGRCRNPVHGGDGERTIVAAVGLGEEG